MTHYRQLMLTLAASLSLLGCSDRQSEAGAERAKRDRAKVAELASRHHASVDWLASLPSRGLRNRFTVDLQQALVRTNGQPVAMEAWLEDVREQNGAVTAEMTMFPLLADDGKLHAADFDLHLVLRCNHDQANELLKPKRDKFANVGMRFAVVAQVESVSRESRPGSAEDEDTFTATGTFVDLAYLEWSQK